MSKKESGHCTYRPRGEYRAKWDMAHRSKKEYYRSAIRAEERELLEESEEEGEESTHDESETENDEEASTGFYLGDANGNLRHPLSRVVHR